jgi:hypothetical protein
MLWHLGRMEALDGLGRTVLDTCGVGQGLWRFMVVRHLGRPSIEARPVVRSVINSLEQSGLVLPFFAKLDFLFPSGALVGYGAPVLEWLARRPCLVWRGPL